MTLIPHGTPEWYRARLGIPTASNAAKFCHRLKRTGEISEEANDYALRLALESIEGAPLRDYYSADMERGNEGEEDAVIAYEAHAGVVCQPGGLVVRPIDGVVIGASPDRLLPPDGGLEAKRPRWNTHARYIAAGKPPPEYVLQMQCQMLVCELDWIDFVSLTDLSSPLHLFVHRVHRDEEAQRLILTCAREITELAAQYREQFLKHGTDMRIAA